MSRILLQPEEKNLLKIIFNLAKKKKVELYLVGGYLRDILLRREKENPDIDFCLRRGSINFAKFVAKELKAGFVVLDQERGVSRVVKKMKGDIYTLDFTDFRGRTLEDDLLHRDFTINTLALGLEKIFSQDKSFFIDPYRAKDDLKAKIIRLVHKNNFDEDPLRILRAFSFSCMLGFKIDKETLGLIKLKKTKLSSVSSERVRDELFKILDSPRAFQYLAQMDKFGVLKLIFPEAEIMRGVKQGPYHHLDVFKHSLETLRQFEILTQELKGNKNTLGYLNEVIAGGRRRRALIKLAAFLHDIGKPKALRHEEGKTKFHGHELIGRKITEDIATRLKLANDELDSLRRMVFWHLRPGYLADNEEITLRAKFRYFRDTGKEGVSILLLSIADQRSTRGPLTSDEERLHHEKVCLYLIREYFRKSKEKQLARIVNGDDLIAKFKLEPSPFIGKILREIEELQAIGKIRTKREALQVAKRFINRKL